MKANPKPWLYGPNWQGQRCEARTRRGTPCKRPARLPVGRCKLHGGASTGPRTKDGLARLTEARTKHGLHQREARRSEALCRARAPDARRTEGARNLALSCVDGSFYARVNLSDFDVCRLRSCVRPFDAVDNTAGLDEVRALGPNQISELVSPDSASGCPNFSSF